MAKAKKQIVFPSKQEVSKDMALFIKHGSTFEDAYANVFKSYHKNQRGILPKNKFKDSGRKSGEVPISKKILDWIGSSSVDAATVVKHFDINASTAHGGMMKLVRVGIFKREAVKGVYHYSKAA